MPSLHNSYTTRAQAQDELLRNGKPLPSTIFKSLSTGCTADYLLQELNKYLSPVLDALSSDSERAKIVAALKTVKNRSDLVAERHVKVGKIDFERHERSLGDGLRELENNVRESWKDGWREQSLMMRQLADEIAEWLPTLWSLGAQEGFEMDLVQECLYLCSHTVQCIKECGSRFEFADAQHKAIQFSNSHGPQVYYVAPHESIERVIDWVWKELLVSSSARGHDALVTSILDTIESLTITDAVFDLLPAPGKAMAAGHHELHNDHWSEDMKEACARVILFREYKRHAAREMANAHNTI